jgi:hypothetical protein
MVVVREEGIGKALFATEPYDFGDVILVETPLISIRRDEISALPSRAEVSGWMGASFIEPTLRALKREFDKLSEEDQAVVLELFCPSVEDIRKSGLSLRDGVTIQYAAALTAAQIICNDNGEGEEEARNLVKLLCIWKFNSTQYQGTKTAIFKLHARINHSCCPNATYHAGSVRALKPISPGDLITIAYFENETLIASTRLRRRVLATSYRFHCECSRCLNAVDFSRTMRCPKCSRCTAVWGLSLTLDSPLKNEDVASCVLCSTTHQRSSMPLEEEASLEEEVVQLQTLVRLTGSASVISIHDLQARILKSLGGNHWTAAAVMKLRYDKDPIDNGFIVMQWGEAYAQWCKLAASDTPWLYHLGMSTVGNGCRPHLPHSRGQKQFTVAGRRYWNECYLYCTKLWGEDDADIRNMRTMFDHCHSQKSRVDVIICTRSKCTRPMEDRLGRSDPKFKCAACGLAHYCNKECQTADWKEHKVVCTACRPLRDFEKVRLCLESRRQRRSSGPHVYCWDVSKTAHSLCNDREQSAVAQAGGASGWWNGSVLLLLGAGHENFL